VAGAAATEGAWQSSPTPERVLCHSVGGRAVACGSGTLAVASLPSPRLLGHRRRAAVGLPARPVPRRRTRRAAAESLRDRQLGLAEDNVREAFAKPGQEAEEGDKEERARVSKVAKLEEAALDREVHDGAEDRAYGGPERSNQKSGARPTS
jgi:hypothetical protein